MHETSDFFYSIITFSYTKYFVHSYTVDVVFTFSYEAVIERKPSPRQLWAAWKSLAEFGTVWLRQIKYEKNIQGLDSIERGYLTGIGNPILEIRRSYERRISTIGFPILVRWHPYIESGSSLNAFVCMICDPSWNYLKVLKYVDLIFQ